MSQTMRERAKEPGFDPMTTPDGVAFQQVTLRLRNMLELFRTMNEWHREIMSLPSSQLKRLVGMRQKVRKLLRFGA